MSYTAKHILYVQFLKCLSPFWKNEGNFYANSPWFLLYKKPVDIQNAFEWFQPPPVSNHIPSHICSKYKFTALTLSPWSFFFLVVVVPERKRGLVARLAGLRPDWRRLQRGRGPMMERQRWPLTFSVGLTPEGKVKRD